VSKHSQAYGNPRNHHHNHNRFTALFPGPPGEPVPEENFWTTWCKGRLTEADTNQPAGRHSIRTNQCPPPTIPQTIEESEKKDERRDEILVPVEVMCDTGRQLSVAVC